MKVRTVKIDGKEYPIMFSLRALMAFEQKTGLTVKDVSESISISDALELCVCGLLEGARVTNKSVVEINFDWLLEHVENDNNILTEIVAEYEGKQARLIN